MFSYCRMCSLEGERQKIHSQRHTNVKLDGKGPAERRGGGLVDKDRLSFSVPHKKRRGGGLVDKDSFSFFSSQKKQEEGG